MAKTVSLNIGDTLTTINNQLCVVQKYMTYRGDWAGWGLPYQKDSLVVHEHCWYVAEQDVAISIVHPHDDATNWRLVFVDKDYVDTAVAGVSVDTSGLVKWAVDFYPSGTYPLNTIVLFTDHKYYISENDGVTEATPGVDSGWRDTGLVDKSYVDTAVAEADDHLVKGTSDDTVPGDLDTKILAGLGIVKTTVDNSKTSFRLAPAGQQGAGANIICTCNPGDILGVEIVDTNTNLAIVDKILHIGIQGGASASVLLEGLQTYMENNIGATFALSAGEDGSTAVQPFAQTPVGTGLADYSPATGKSLSLSVDHLVKGTSDDTIPGDLDTKILAGSGITKTTVDNPTIISTSFRLAPAGGSGADIICTCNFGDILGVEIVSDNSDPSVDENKILKVCRNQGNHANTTVLAGLINHVTANNAGITFVLADGASGNTEITEFAQTEISGLADYTPVHAAGKFISLSVDHLVKGTSDDTIPGDLDTKIVAGTGITKTILESTGTKKIFKLTVGGSGANIICTCNQGDILEVIIDNQSQDPVLTEDKILMLNYYQGTYNCSTMLSRLTAVITENNPSITFALAEGENGDTMITTFGETLVSNLDNYQPVTGNQISLAIDPLTAFRFDKFDLTHTVDNVTSGCGLMIYAPKGLVKNVYFQNAQSTSLHFDVETNTLIVDVLSGTTLAGIISEIAENTAVANGIIVTYASGAQPTDNILGLLTSTPVSSMNNYDPNYINPNPMYVPDGTDANKSTVNKFKTVSGTPDETYVCKQNGSEYVWYQLADKNYVDTAVAGAGGASDHLVKVTTDDTIPGVLDSKILAGSGIVKTTIDNATTSFRLAPVDQSGVGANIICTCNPGDILGVEISDAYAGRTIVNNVLKISMQGDALSAADMLDVLQNYTSIPAGITFALADGENGSTICSLFAQTEITGLADYTPHTGKIISLAVDSSIIPVVDPLAAFRYEKFSLLRHIDDTTIEGCGLMVYAPKGLVKTVSVDTNATRARFDNSETSGTLYIGVDDISSTTLADIIASIDSNLTDNGIIVTYASGAQPTDLILSPYNYLPVTILDGYEAFTNPNPAYVPEGTNANKSTVGKHVFKTVDSSGIKHEFICLATASGTYRWKSCSGEVVVSEASTSSPTPNADTTDTYVLSALAANATFGAPTGTPIDGQKLMLRIKDNGTSRTLGWNSVYAAVGVTLPTATVAGKYTYVGLVYNSQNSKWDCIATVTQS